MKQRPFVIAFVVIVLATFAVAFTRRHDPLPEGWAADEVVVDKSDRTLALMKRGHAFKVYRVTFGRDPKGKKAREGDNRTPEGLYRIDSHNWRSKYHVALHVSYPNAEDLRRAKAGGYSAGGDIMVHGIRRSLAWIGPFHRTVNWTRGCIAVTNGEIDEIARAVPDGTPILIRP